MAETQTAPAPEKESMYVNRTKVTQVVYPKGQWDKRIVPVGHTVCLTPEQYRRYFAYFKPKNEEKAEAK